MSPRDFLSSVLDPGLVALRAAIGDGDPSTEATDALCLLLFAIAGQESAWTERLQSRGSVLAGGRGYWQFEKTAIRTILNAPASALRADRVLVAQEIYSGEDFVYEAIAWNDNLAVGFARLLLWLDPAPLPPVGEEDTSWSYYVRNWRPGRPSRSRWHEIYAESCETISGGT